MKKLNILFLSVIGLGMSVASCSKGDPKPMASTFSAVGKWEAGTLEGTYQGQAVPAGTPDSLISDLGCTTPAYYQFDEAGILKYGFYDSTATTPCSLLITSANYTIGANNASYTLNFTDNAGKAHTLAYPIVSLTATQLKWRQADSFPDPNDATKTITFDLVHVMNRK